MTQAKQGAEPNYLTLKRAAQILGVHEQTLRSWERKGLMRMAHLPKSGYRRVPMEEVERLQATMLADAEPTGVRLALPNRDEAALTQAFELAAAVRTELAACDSMPTFDEFMAARRGRVWAP
ncbi:MAG: MerR family DNA-binding transcriptional regulator [Caldilineaceae bacterium]